MNFGIIIVITIAALWAFGVFLGAIGSFSKNFSHTPAALDSSDIKAKEQETIDETEAKRQKMMDDMKQKMEDSSNQRF